MPDEIIVPPGPIQEVTAKTMELLEKLKLAHLDPQSLGIIMAYYGHVKDLPEELRAKLSVDELHLIFTIMTKPAMFALATYMDDQMKGIFAEVEKLTKAANVQTAKANQLIEELERKHATH